MKILAHMYYVKFEVCINYDPHVEYRDYDIGDKYKISIFVTYCYYSTRFDYTLCNDDISCVFLNKLKAGIECGEIYNETWSEHNVVSFDKPTPTGKIKNRKLYIRVHGYVLKRLKNYVIINILV